VHVISALGYARQPCLLTSARTDPDAFADFYEAYSDDVFRFVARRVLEVEVALDLTSETFAIALERRLQFRGRTAKEEQGWLYSIARTQLLQFWRTGKVERQAIARMRVDLPTLRDEELDWFEERADIQAIVSELHWAVGRLPEDQWTAIQMRVLDERSYPEIAQAQNVTEDLVRARVSRGLRSLAQNLHGRGIRGEDVA
jgi:RNA polymerase sigma factor (sigma-70 family)